MVQYPKSARVHRCRSELPLRLSLKHKSFQSSDVVTIFKRHRSVNEPTHQQDRIIIRALSRLDESLLLCTVVNHTLTSDRNSVICHFNIAKPSLTKVHRVMRNLASLSVTASKTDFETMVLHCKSMLRQSWPPFLIPLPTSSTAFCAPS